MFWRIPWALVLGLALSGAVEAVVSKDEMTRLLPDAKLRSLLVASGLGAAMVVAGYIVEVVFGALGLIPGGRHARSSTPTSRSTATRS